MYKIKLSPYAKTFYNEWLLEPNSSRYNLSTDQTLHGDLDVEKLRGALKKYILEHVVLNSHIKNIKGEPHWVPNDSISELEYLDNDNKISTAELLSYVKKSFDLYKGPLYRFRLLRVGKKVYRFIVVMHHLIMDGSASLDTGVFEAISNYYNDKNYAAKHSIKEQKKIIADLTNTLSAKLEKNQSKYKEFWHKNLSDIDNIDLTFLRLSKDYKKIFVRNNPIKEISFRYGKTELAKLNQVKLKYGITPYVYSMSIFALLLHRYTGQEHLAISYPITIKEGLDFIYGVQINTNLIPYQFSKTTTIADLLNQSQKFFKLTTRDDIKYGYYPIADIIRDGSNSDLLNVCFAQTFFREKPFKFNGITKVKLHTTFSVDGVTKDILLFEQNARNSKNELNYRVRYDKRIINEELLNNFITCYKILFLEILEDLLTEKNNKLVSSYSLLDPKQYRKLVYEFNKTEKDYPRDKTIHALFEEQVLKTPNNIAVVYENTKLTYQELNSKANQLARYLRRTYNIKPDNLIVLCLDRSEQMIIAMLGVLKSGGAYVPIDPKYPDERIGYVLNDTKTKVILTNNGYKNRLQKIIKQKAINTEVMAIDNEVMRSKLTEQSDINQNTSTTSTNLVYVIYTSGTTGEPKGVLIEHRSVSNYVTYLIKYNKLNSRSIGSQYAAISFDALVIEIYPMLLSGGSLYIVPEEYRLEPTKINDFFHKNQITYAFLPPKVAEPFFELKNSSLINLIVGGEKLENFTKQTYRIINAYGPTETTVQSTSFIVGELCKNIPIGKPINNVKCYVVVDKHLNLAPISAVGELMIGGESLARGYLNRLNLTTEKFINNPFQTEEEKAQIKNSRLYKTGDLVRVLPDGNLEYIGRNDSQVKIRGYRIELGEIENKLLNYSDIKQAVVLTKNRMLENKSDKYLLAYYVADKKLDETKIQSYLATQLPDYMLPQVLIYLNKLPLTINGKLDKNLLPEPELIKQSEYTAPLNKLEKKVCKIYAQILNLPITKVGTKDDFFRMGGDSISSIQLVSQIRQQLGLTVSVKDIFSYRNVEQLVNNILANKNIQKEDIKEIKRENKPTGKVDLLPIQKWFFENVKSGFYPKYNHWNQSFLIKIPELDIKTLELSIEKLLEHHDAFRFRYKNFQQNYIEMDFSKEAKNIKKIDVSKFTTEKIKKELIKIQSDFNIKNGPIYTIAYLHGYKDKTARLFFALHHLIVDSVSWRILTHDISRLYKLLQDENNINKTSQELLGQKGSSYRQWTKEIKNYKPSKKELNYWQGVLKDYVCIPKNNGEASYREFSLTSQLTKQLLTKAGSTYHTQINDLLLSALTRTLAEIFDRQINHITLEGHGREEINPKVDVTKTLGWFTTMYPVRLANCGAISDLIKATKETLRSIPRKGIGYGAIKGYKNLPNISFNYLGQINNEKGFWSIVDHIISIDPHNQNNNILDIYGYVMDNILKFQILCNDKSLRITKITNQFKSNIKEIIEHCVNSTRSYLTSSDTDWIIKQEHLNKIQENTEIEEIYLANNLQQGFILHTIRQGKIDDAYLSQFIWRYKTEINKDVFKKAWQLAQKKYPSLRLRFAWEDELIQIIDKEQKLDFRYVDLMSLSKKPDVDYKSQLAEIISKDRRERYDLRRGNLIRIYLIKSSKNDYSCICSIHHIILDGWSMPLLFNSIHEIYSQLLKNKHPQIIEDITYKKAQKYFQEHKNEDKKYWDNCIKQIEDKVDLKTLLKPSARNIEIKNHTIIDEEQEQSIKITGQKLAKLKDICQTNAITINAIIQYVWHKLLHIYGDSDTTAVGTVVSGRNFPIYNIENSVGLFLNTLPLIFVHNNELDLIEQIKLIQNLINEINGKSNVNLADLQIEGERLFDSLIVYENYPSPKDTADIKYEDMREIFKVDYPLAIIVYEKELALTVRLKYAGELFDQKTILQLLNRLRFFIEQISENPYKKTLNYLTQEEYQEIVINYNKTEKAYPKNKTIHQLFEDQALKTPNNIALVFDEKRFTYKELNDKANQLANYLLKNNDIKPDDLIALILNRSEYVIISILAVLKTGAAYVPIDPNYPAERIKYILEDTKAKIIVNGKKTRYEVRDNYVITIDSEKTQQILLKENTHNPKTNVTSSNLIYVIYTSGTTGKPKGVMVEHKSVVNYITYLIHANKLNHQAKGSQYANFGFDATVIEIYPILLSGGTLYVIKDTDKLNPVEVNNFFIQNFITYAFLPTPFAEIFFELKNSKLKNLIVGGDKLQKFIPQSYQVTNAYGPTEATVQSNLFIVSKQYQNIPIGKPIPNITNYIVDKKLETLPTGVVGELYIGGEGIVRGYLNQPQLTAEKFISNPFQTPEEKSKNTNNRLYKTGDLVRMLPNGNIEYIGRNDFQVKIRGHRVELGEIEEKLINYPKIKQAVVVTEKNNKYLIGYYVAEKKLDEQKIKNYLSEQLPDYMVPIAFIYMQKLPLTVNGKLNKKALPQPRLKHKGSRTTPTNKSVEAICEAFKNVLNLKQVGINDDFFSLGGNSIQAIKLTSILQTNFDIKIADIFNLRTPLKLAKNITFGKDFLQHKLEQVKLSYKTKQDDNPLFETKVQQEPNDYLESIKNFNIDISLKKRIDNVLLTGSTGYLGCNILNQMLKLTGYKIYLLIRANSREEAIERINEKYNFYFNEELNNLINFRVFVINADIEKKYLGLSEIEYQDLTTKIDSIIHAAALVKHYGEYDKFYSANVVATTNLLEFAKLTELKDFHYVSTIGVLNYTSVATSKKSKCTEDDLPASSEIINNVYIRTKLLGEHKIAKYQDLGLNCNIYRVGNLAFMSESYRTQNSIDDNAFYNWLKCLFTIKCSSKVINMVEISQTDSTAEAIVKIFDKSGLNNRVYHVFNPYLYDMTAVFKSNGCKILPIETFINHIKQFINNGDHYNLVVRFLLRQGWIDWWDEQNVFYNKTLQNRTQYILQQLGFKWLHINDSMMNSYLHSLKLIKKKEDDMNSNNKPKIFSDLERLTPLIPAPVFWLDINSVVLGGNNLAFEIGGSVLDTKKLTIGKTPYEYYPKDVADTLMRNIGQVIQEKKVIEFEESIEDVVTGKIRHFLTTRAPLFDDDGINVVGTIGTSVEITDRKEKEKLRAKNKLQKIKIAEQDRFKKVTDQVIHDLASPHTALLMTIEGYKNEIPEKVHMALRSIAERVVSVISRLECEPEEDDLNAPWPKAERQQVIMLSLVLLELLTEKRLEYAKLPVKFTYDSCQKCNFTFIRTQYSAFRRMISNLLNNAVDALDGKAGEVNTKLNVVDEKIKITINDTGKGMSQEIIDKIMNGIMVTNKENGSGIGFTQIMGTLEDNLGKIEINSKIGKGTEISISFPTKYPPTWIARELKLNKGDTVVVLDDDVSIHEVWNLRFKDHKEGINIKCFTSGSETIDYINKSPKKEKVCLLADHELNQDLTGLDVIENINIEPERSFLVTNHHSDPIIRNLAMKRGMKILPKQLIGYIPLKITETKPEDCEPKKVDIVLVYDDRNLIDALAVLLKNHKKTVDTYLKSSHFLEKLSQYDKNTMIFIDRGLDNGYIDVIKELYAKYYTRLYLLSSGDFRILKEKIPVFVTAVTINDTNKILELCGVQTKSLTIKKELF